MNDPSSNASVEGESADRNSGVQRLIWKDVDRREWSIELKPGHLVLQSGTDVLDLPQSAWTRDIYAARHGDGFIIRIETFDCAVRFMISAEQASPFFAHVNPPRAVESAAPEAKAEPAAPVRLLWPKVSPLAVWALVCASLSFLPLIGWAAALATIVLLVLHRQRVRRTPAWRHSRALCSIALVLMVAGLGVSVLAVWGMWASGSAELALPPAPAGGQAVRNWGVIVGALFVVLLSLTVHEAAHAISAWWLGDGLARSLGRVTLNPMAHIDPFGTVILPLILAAAGGPVFGYARPVPVQVASLRRYRRAHILISLAGPGSNLLLAALSLMALLAVGCIVRLAVPEAAVHYLAYPDLLTPVSASGFALAPAIGALCTILKVSFMINTLLALFNLLPIPPLDGSWVLEHLFPNSMGRLYASIRPYGFLVFIAAFYSGAFNVLAYPLVMIWGPAFDLLGNATGMY